MLAKTLNPAWYPMQRATALASAALDTSSQRMTMNSCVLGVSSTLSLYQSILVVRLQRTKRIIMNEMKLGVNEVFKIASWMES